VDTTSNSVSLGLGPKGPDWGTFSKTVLTRDEAVERAREEAKEQGKSFDPGSVKSGVTVFQIAGTGAVIAEK